MSHVHVPEGVQVLVAQRQAVLERRAADRAAFARRRRAGLARRHAAKLARAT